MAERQKHGLDFENLCESKYGIKLSDKYTDKFDGTFNDLPVSIKCTKQGAEIDMADYFRNFEITEDFYLIVGFWKNKKNNIVDTKFLKINGSEYHSLFYNNINSKFKDLLKNITNDYSDDLKWKEEIKNLKKEWIDNTPNLIRPRFKRDHQKQKRIQCAISNKDFFDHFLNKYETGDIK